MITRLTNKEGVEISQQQASMLNLYCIQYEENNQLKKQDFFVNQQLNTVVYYKNENEILSDIISEFSGTRLVIKEFSYVGNKKIEYNNVYNTTGALDEQYNFAYNQNLEVICWEYIDNESGLPIYTKTRKFYFDSDIDPEDELFDCTYNEDGSLDRILYAPHAIQDSMDFWEDGVPGESDIETLRGLTGLSEEEMNYYLTADILPEIIT